MVCVYLIKSLKNEIFYTGISEDPQKRLREHNSGKLRTTSGQKPFILVYSKPHKDYKEARKHERWLKKKSVSYKQKLAGIWSKENQPE